MYIFFTIVLNIGLKIFRRHFTHVHVSQRGPINPEFVQILVND